ncbi:RagB/SusD family nutrient uptake outer membrane protein [Chitinophaga qingshengii]|nr:RagB/SusD family nutrient uptake outer membrane protein [Chitinophaga qingshengii]
MKRCVHFLRILLLLLVIVFSGCKKFLNVEPLDNLSGNNYWKSKNDVETFTKDIYRLFRVAATSNILIIQADYRCGPCKQSKSAFPARQDFTYISQNNLRKALAARADRTLAGYDPYTEWWQANVRYDMIPDWNNFYRVIQSCNILIQKLNDVPDPELTGSLKAKYNAEAVFMRALSYFFMVRLYGDVPYYTTPYNQDPLPRTDMKTVLANCIAEVEKIKNDLPWTYDDPANRAVRAMHGAALALGMHMNMWLAGFDPARKQAYYEATDRLANELEQLGEKGQGAYRLLPLSESVQLFSGRSQEGLFEIPQNFNYGELVASRVSFSFSVLHEPYRKGKPYSELVYYSQYMKKIYPESQADGRKEKWFDQYIYDETGLFQFFKFFSVYANNSEGERSSDDNFMIFRYADALLLHAEALAELGRDDEATALLNRIRQRAGAELFPAEPGGGNLKDAVYWERCRELMGEGHYFYDLVRTKKLIDPKYCYNPISYSEFIQGAWTWPISKDAMKNNPYMRLNDFWQ